MKNKRQISKEQSSIKILVSAKEKIIEKGVLYVTTLEIAQNAKVAHGTLFSHFSSKEVLVARVFKEELIRIASKLKELSYDKHIRLREMLGNYFELMIEDEPLLLTIAREFPFYHDDIKNEIVAMESIVKNMIYERIEEGVNNNLYVNVDITMALAYLFGTINYYLARKDMFVINNESVLELKKDKIINTFFDLLILKK